MSQAEVIDLLTLCTAFTLSAMESHDAKRNADDIADAVGLNMAMEWTPHLHPAPLLCQSGGAL